VASVAESLQDEETMSCTIVLDVFLRRALADGGANSRYAAKLRRRRISGGLAAHPTDLARRRPFALLPVFCADCWRANCMERFWIMFFRRLKITLNEKQD
jgi:hypothetical protein